MKKIDLRSDTVTHPTQEMRNAMHTAIVGDDVLQEDPTINELEKQASKLLNKEAALFVPSGTMGNLISFLVHCPRGTEAILGDKSHTFIYEAGGISAFGGIHSHQLKNRDDGTIDLHLIKNAFRKENVHFPRTSLISLENTHNMCNGSPIGPEYFSKVSAIAKENNIKVHVDGARIFNASVSLNLDVHKLVKDVDSITFCLSKGLASPVGSVLCGSQEFIFESRRIRKALGGGIRQGGIIVASGLLSINKMVHQLKTDHVHAKQLADGINNIDGLIIDTEKVKSNIIYFGVNPEKMQGQKIVKKMAEYNIHFFEVQPNRFRLVTHWGILETDVNFVIDRLKTILSE